MILIVISRPAFANTECTDGKTKLTKKDGRVLEWSNCFEEENNYCTRKSYGKICLQKDNIISVEQYDDTSPDTIVIDNRDKFKHLDEKLELETQEYFKQREEYHEEQKEKIRREEEREEEVRKQEEEARKQRGALEEERMKEIFEGINKRECYRNCLKIFGVRERTRYAIDQPKREHCSNVCGTN